MDILAAMQVYVRVVETGSFSAVARETGSTQPTISRLVAQLEDHLGARLLQRTTRTLAVTDEGRQYYHHARQALLSVSEAESAVGRRRAEPSGLVRIATPVAFSRLHVLHRLPRLMERYPKLEIDLVMHDANADLVGEGIDLALRIGEIDDPALVARRIGTTRLAVTATRDYLDRHGRPQQPDDLRGHDCIVYTRLASGNVWHFDGPRGAQSVPVRGRLQFNNSEAVREAVLMGLGIGLLSTWQFRDAEERSRVEIVLADYQTRRLPVSLVYPSRRFVSAAVRAVSDFLAEEFRREPLLADG